MQYVESMHYTFIHTVGSVATLCSHVQCDAVIANTQLMLRLNYKNRLKKQRYNAENLEAHRHRYHSK